MWAWLLHRITGVAIFFFLVVHVLDTALVRLAPEAYNQVIGMYHTPIMAVGEAGIVAAVTLHALNGIRIILTDAFSWGARWQRKMFYGVLALFVVVMAIFLPIHFTHAFRVPAVEALKTTSGDGFPFTYLAMALSPIPALRRSYRETAGWLAMRASGIALIVLVAGHLITNLMLGEGVRQINFAFVAGKWASPFWQTWSLLLLILAMAHGANGVRTIIDDYSRSPGLRLFLKGLLYLVTFVMVILGVLVIFTLGPCPLGAAAHLLPAFCFA